MADLKKEPLLLSVSREDFELFSDKLSDILCWAQGFKAGAGTENSHLWPLGVEELQSLNIRIKSLLARGES
jgi:hypothetical protein